MFDLSQIEGFDWDEGNSRKSAKKHDVSQAEAEQIFFNNPLLIVEDVRHSILEVRLHALGRTDVGRLLHASFTLRGEPHRSKQDCSRSRGQFCRNSELIVRRRKTATAKSASCDKFWMSPMVHCRINPNLWTSRRCRNQVRYKVPQNHANWTEPQSIFGCVT